MYNRSRRRRVSGFLNFDTEMGFLMNQRENVSISVIVPIYNVEKYLRKCLDSILAQTFRDLEIICVDDGSTDGSGLILDEYAVKDDRIQVIHKDNTGYGHSMNAGLDAARGKYVGIVESDDAVFPEFFETLYDAVKRDDLDIVKSECWFCWDSYGYRFRYHDTVLDKYFGKTLGKDRLWLRCLFIMNIWTGLYRREMLVRNNIRFHETPGASYQDNGFWMQGMIFADRVMFLDHAGYLYRQDNETASVKDPKKIYTMVDEYEWLGRQLQGEVSEREMSVVDFYRLTRGYWSFYRIGDEYKREFCDRLISDYDKYGDVFFRDLWWQEKFLEIKSDPDAFCERVINAKKELEHRLDSVARIIIYGAGQRGERAYRILMNHGRIDKIGCFVETNSPKKDSIGQVSVYRIDDERVSFEDSVVIISAARDSKMHGEMAKILNSYGINDPVDSDILFDNYYNLI